MSALVETLRACEVFGEVPCEVLERVVGRIESEQVPRRAFLFHEGDPARWLWVVESGRVKIFKTASGGQEVALDLLGRGQVIGGVAVLEAKPYPASARSIEPTVVVKLPREVVQEIADRAPGFLRRMALMMGERLREAHDHMRALAAEPVEQRVAAVLLRIARREAEAATGADDELRIPFHLTRQNLADLAGTTVETAIRTMSRWTRAGLVQDDEGRIAIVDAGLMREIAGD